MAAQTLLKDPSLTIKEIAGRTGFAGASQFSRQFFRVVGQTPTQFRQRN